MYALGGCSKYRTGPNKYCTFEAIFLIGCKLILIEDDKGGQTVYKVWAVIGFKLCVHLINPRAVDLKIFTE